jgi:hypothetical protein
LTALTKEENLTFSKKVKMRFGEGPEPKNRKLTLRLYDRRLSNIVNDFDDYDPMDFLYFFGGMLFTKFS